MSTPQTGKPKRVCVFCDERPQAKTNEDIIPRWCSKLSGKDNVPINLSKLDGSVVTLPFKRLVLPACEQCNNNMSDLENNTKTVFKKLREGEIHGPGASTLLDWLDKVRVGLWRYQLSLNSQHHTIRPRFGINRRLGAHDRIAIIQRLKNENVKGIALLGVSSRAFLHQPSVFGIVVRDIAVISFSNAFLLYDFFNMTEPPEENSEKFSDGQVGRRFKGFMPFNRSVSELSMIGGIQVYQFKAFFSQNPAKHINNFTWFNSKSTQGAFEGDEMIEIGRSKYDGGQFPPLFHLNVVELQQAALYDMAWRASAQETNLHKQLYNELDAEAKFALQSLNEASLFDRARSRISIV